MQEKDGRNVRRLFGNKSRNGNQSGPMGQPKVLLPAMALMTFAPSCLGQLTAAVDLHHFALAALSSLFTLLNVDHKPLRTFFSRARGIQAGPASEIALTISATSSTPKLFLKWPAREERYQRRP